MQYKMEEVAGKLEGSNVLVTGGCGFIGSHMVKKLWRLRVKKIIVIDDLSHGRNENLGEIRNRVTIIKHTLGGRKDEMLTRWLKGVNYVFHLAALKHNQSNNNPELILNRNIMGTFNLCEAAVKNRIKKIVFSSSVYAYGRRHSPALKESETSLPKTTYGISKLAGERLLSYFFKKYGLSSLALRYFFVYGQGQITGAGYKTVIIKNFEKIIRGVRPVIFGDGRQVFDYIYIDDVIDASIRAMNSGYADEVFNVGSSEPVSVKRLIDTMLKVSGKSLDKRYMPQDETKGTYRVADIAKIKRLLDFKPAISLREGLEKMYKWMINNRQR